MTNKLLFTFTLLLGLGFASTASAAPRDLDCNSKIAHKLLWQMLDNNRLSGLGAATPKKGVRFDMRDPKTRAGRKASRRYRGAWNELHLVRSHNKWGLWADLAFSNLVNTNTLVVACTYELEYGSRAARFIAGHKTTLRYKKDRQARYYAPPMADSHKKARVTLLWVSPSSVVAAGQRYNVRVSQSKKTRRHSIRRM